jgi:hypothetical protein
MSNWGAGPELGLLTLVGYVVVIFGALILWRDRGDVFVWVLDEVGALRRHLSRHTAVGPFYGVRSGSRLKLLPATFLRFLARRPRARIQIAGFLVFLGTALFVLDFFI